jgi:hypothetical protein
VYSRPPVWLHWFPSYVGNSIQKLFDYITICFTFWWWQVLIDGLDRICLCVVNTWTRPDGSVYSFYEGDSGSCFHKNWKFQFCDQLPSETLVTFWIYHLWSSTFFFYPLESAVTLFFWICFWHTRHTKYQVYSFCRLKSSNNWHCTCNSWRNHRTITHGGRIRVVVCWSSVPTVGKGTEERLEISHFKKFVPLLKFEMYLLIKIIRVIDWTWLLRAEVPNGTSQK